VSKEEKGRVYLALYAEVVLLSGKKRGVQAFMVREKEGASGNPRKRKLGKGDQTNLSEVLEEGETLPFITTRREKTRLKRGKEQEDVLNYPATEERKSE